MAREFGSFEAFAAWAEREVAAGVLDEHDFPHVVQSLARWERDGTWGRPAGPAGVWTAGA